MELQVAMLCRGAMVERGHLDVVGGGVTSVAFRAYPHRLGLTLAVVLELGALDGERPHTFRVELVDEDELALADLCTEFALTQELSVEEVTRLPAAFPLDGMELPRAGCYELRVAVDGDEVRRLALRADRASGMVPA